MVDRQPVLIFDGRCGFCTRCVEWLLPRLRDPVRALPYQAIELAPYGLTEEQAQRTAWWVDPDGSTESGHRAVARGLSSCVSAVWRLLGRALLLPPLSWAAAVGYRLVSRYRSHLPGTTPACRRPWDMQAGRPAG